MKRLSNMNISNCCKHFYRILKHKKEVLKICCSMGLYRRGFTHDLSKFHPKEFIESTKYYNKNSSPILLCKSDKGYSNAWQHHHGHNDHHFEYWIDYNKGQITPIKMPFKCLLEMIADWLAAQKTYNGSIDYKKEFEWFNNNKHNFIIHSTTLQFAEDILMALSEGLLTLRFIKKHYKEIKELYDGTI